MYAARNQFFRVRRVKVARVVCLFLTLLAFQVRANEDGFESLVAKGDLAGKKGDLAAALKAYTAAEKLEAANSTNLCALTKCFCDLMHSTSSPELQQELARAGLQCSEAAVRADPRNATSHICVAICYAKNFPYVDNRTKVFYSRSIKAESERAIELDPGQDVAYYLLGRWNYGVANMNLLYRGLVRIIYGGLPSASNAEAIKDLKRAIALNPRRIIHHEQLAKVYLAIGEKELARHELEKCPGLKPLDEDDAEAQAEAAKELATLAK